MTTSSAAPAPEDQAAAAAVPARIVAAWAAHDATAFSEAFAEDGTMILPGVFLKGREEIRSYMAEGFTGPYKGTQVTGRPLNVAFLGPEAGLMITEGGVIAAGQTEVTDEAAIRASWLVAKRNGEWLLASYHNCPRDAD